MCILFTEIDLFSYHEIFFYCVNFRFLIFLILLESSLAAFASFPPVRNFSRAEYAWGSQNWGAAEDVGGMMYFGNKFGLLTYDGTRWRNYTLPNQTTVRAVYADNVMRRVYAAGTEEFGYFYFDGPSRRMSYVSLASEFTDVPAGYGEIWKIHQGDKHTWFQADHAIFGVSDDGDHFVASVREKINCSAYIRGIFYVALSDKGFCQLRDGKFVSLDPNALLADKRVAAICPFNDKILLVTQFDGLFVYDSRGVRPFPTKIDAFLRENQAFCAETRDNKIAIGTVNGGLVVYDLNHELSPIHSNTDSGMQNNTILSVFFDSHNNIWCGLDNGLDYVLYDAPYRSLLSRAGFCGAGYASIVDGGSLYLGSNQGLYRTPFNKDYVFDAPKRLLQGQVWKIRKIGNYLAACTDGGLYIDGGSGFERVDGVSGAWDIHEIFSNPRLALASTYDNFYLLEERAGRWVSQGRVTGFSDINGSFVIDEDGYIWISHWMKGVYRLHIDIAHHRFDIVDFFDTHHGLPSAENTSVALYKNSPAVSSAAGYYRLSGSGRTLEPHDELNAFFSKQISPHLYNGVLGELWSVTPDNIYVARTRADGSREIDSITFSPMSSLLIPGFDSFNFVDDSRVIASTQDGFYELDTRRAFDKNSRPVSLRTFVSAIYANQDSLVYLAFAANNEPRITLTSDLNSLRFEFAAADNTVSANEITFSHYLENYEDTWSTPMAASSKEYTQLREGDYTLHLRAINSATRVVDEKTIQFSILPPWYRSSWAKAAYALLGFLLVYLTFRVISYFSERNSIAISRRKEEEMEHLRIVAAEEALRKENEISDLKNQQLEQDIRHKAGELSNITMNVVRKNEILMNISSRLTKLQRTLDVLSPAETNAQIAKIQSLIQDNISHDDDWKTFTGNFDAVYEDFTKRLRKLHPSLTPTELKVCCYLRMGLNSKDMAPLFNISYRSVEMTRYRLRKKLGLEREDNLSDYLHRI